jgi:outer membrane immunogenic protein
MIVAATIGSAALVAPSLADGVRKSHGPDPYSYLPEAIIVDYSWSGIYIGGHAGGAHTEFEWLFTGSNEPFEKAHSAFIGGVHGGLQRQWGRIVLGAEVSYSWTDTNVTITSPITPAATGSVEVSDLFMVAGRFGVAHDNLLAYAKAGYATADVEFRSGVTTSSSRDHGWVGGLGLEYGLTPQISLGLEYNYVRLNHEAGAPAALAGLGTGSIEDAGIDMQSVVARLNFKFGRRDEPVPLK